MIVVVVIGKIGNPPGTGRRRPAGAGGHRSLAIRLSLAALLTLLNYDIILSTGVAVAVFFNQDSLSIDPFISKCFMEVRAVAKQSMIIFLSWKELLSNLSGK